MYRAGQIVFDENINEPVVFLMGGGDVSGVVSTGVKNEESFSNTVDLIPLWDNKDEVFFGKYVHKAFNDRILDLDKEQYAKYAAYIDEINKELSTNGKDKDKKYHLKG